MEFLTLAPSEAAKPVMGASHTDLDGLGRKGGARHERQGDQEEFIHGCCSYAKDWPAGLAGGLEMDVSTFAGPLRLLEEGVINQDKPL